MASFMGWTHREAVTEPGSVLLVEDVPAERHAIATALRMRGHEVFEADSCEQALRLFRGADKAPKTHIDVVLTDLRLPDGEVVNLLPSMRVIDATVPVYIMTGFATIDVAVRAVKLGAEEFLTKPIELAKLIRYVERSIEQRRSVSSKRERRFAPELFLPHGSAEAPTSSSPQMNELMSVVSQLETNELRPSILLIGELGTGKSLLAQHIHALSDATGPLIDVRCAGLMTDFIEPPRPPDASEKTPLIRMFEAAEGGALFFQDVGELPAPIQSKLAAEIEERSSRPRGVRLLSSSCHELVDGLESRLFRADLYYRLSTVTLKVPPLRDRLGDLPELALHLLRRACGERASDMKLSEDAADKLVKHSWPGNLRELSNVIERALVLSHGPLVTADAIKFDSDYAPRMPSATLEEVERRYIERALEAERGRVKDAALRLGVPRSTLYQKIKNFGIRLPERARSTSGTTLKATSGEHKLEGEDGDSDDAVNDDLPSRRTTLDEA